MVMSAEMMQMVAKHHVSGPVDESGISYGMTGEGEQVPEVVFGLAPTATPETTPDSVRNWLQVQFEHLRNPRLTLGKNETAPGGNIIAEIRTFDGALVQKLSFNRYPGFVRRIDRTKVVRGLEQGSRCDGS